VVEPPEPHAAVPEVTVAEVPEAVVAEMPEVPEAVVPEVTVPEAVSEMTVSEVTVPEAATAMVVILDDGDLVRRPLGDAGRCPAREAVGRGRRSEDRAPGDVGLRGLGRSRDQDAGGRGTY
jgi:hypothetical protein